MAALAGRDQLLRDYLEAIEVFAEGVRACPEERWTASLWEVRTSDPWIWPKEGTAPVPARTVASIQEFSATWYVGAHCAFFLDFYLSGPHDFTVQPPFEAVAEEGFDADGAIELPRRTFARDEVLTYIAHGRAKAEAIIPALTVSDGEQKIPEDHPWAGATYAKLLQVNLHHIREHGAQIARWTSSSDT